MRRSRLRHGPDRPLTHSADSITQVTPTRHTKLTTAAHTSLVYDPVMTTPAFHRPSNRFGLRLASRTGPRSEDAQPNESVNRRQRQPPTVNSAAHTRRSWWARRGQNQPPAAQQGIPRERTGPSRRAQPSTSVKHAVPYARPQSLATAGGIGYPNTAYPPIDAGPRQLRQGHSVSAPEWPTSGSSVSMRQRQLASPKVEIKHEIPTETASSFASSVSPVSSETLVGEHKVKKERDMSPELYAQPQLSTSGSKRYAPLPVECRKSHPNYAAARSAWARKEQQALKRLGLRVVRSFIRFVTVSPSYPSLTSRYRIRREDGMVIDWCVQWVDYISIRIEYLYQGGHRLRTHGHSGCYRTRTTD